MHGIFKEVQRGLSRQASKDLDSFRRMCEKIDKNEMDEGRQTGLFHLNPPPIFMEINVEMVLQLAATGMLGPNGEIPALTSQQLASLNLSTTPTQMSSREVQDKKMMTAEQMSNLQDQLDTGNHLKQGEFDPSGVHIQAVSDPASFDATSFQQQAAAALAAMNAVPRPAKK